MKKLSLIVPVYNVEKYVSKCLESICGEQNIPSSMYEVIVVNDGSPDNSCQIVADLAMKYKNIIIKDRTNGGLSAARNTGIELAKGEYVMFVDSDDYLQKNMLKSLVDQLDFHHPDVLSFRYTSFQEDDHSSADSKSPACSRRCTVFPSHDFLTRKNFFTPAVWSYVYRRTFMEENSLSFMEGVLHEDVEFTPRAILSTETIVHWDCAIYRYLIRHNSIMNDLELLPRRIDSFEKIFPKLLEFANNRDMSPQAKSALGIFLDIFSRRMLGLCIQQKDHKILGEKILFLKESRLHPFPYHLWNIGFRSSIRSRLGRLKLSALMLKMKLSTQ